MGNLIGHSFQIQVRVYLDWVPTVEETRILFNSQASVCSGAFQEFDPATNLLWFKNATEIEQVGDWSNKVFCYSPWIGKYLVRQYGEFRLTIGETYELENFPLDVQDLPLKIQLGTG